MSATSSKSDGISSERESRQEDVTFRNWVTADGTSRFPAAKGRYHLYASLACPFASRTIIGRSLKGLENVVSCTIVHWLKGAQGWMFTDQDRRCSLDSINNATYLRDIYQKANPDYHGAYSVPVLWDKETETIVSNESSEILRMFNSEFNEFCEMEEQRKLDLYPEHLRTQIDELNSWIQPLLNSGVYRVGFARSQDAYNTAVTNVFNGLDKVEAILCKQRYLTGSQLTEADIRLFTTLIRFDAVYHQHFKCNKKQLKEYPSLWGYTRDIYQLPGISDTVDMVHIRYSYMINMKNLNPSGIVAIGPDLDYNEPHGRDKMK